MNEDTMPGHATTPPAVRPKHVGRPTKFNQKLADEICGMLAEGMSVRAICRDPKMPAMSQIFNWLSINEEFQEQYTRAKNETADALAEDIQDIADRTLKGEYDPNAARVAIDAYKWTAAKLKPKKYGDKLDHTSGGKELPAPILNIMINPNATNDNKRTYIESETENEEVPKSAPNRGIIPASTPESTQNSSNIMDELNG
jgi:hypothetical protein